MTQKLKISLFLGPKDGLVMYWDDVSEEFIYFDYESMTRIIAPNFATNEYHTYRLSGKNENEYVYSYDGVSKIDFQDESTD